MKKILLSLAAVAMFATCSFAQVTGGIKGGFNFANLGGDAEDTKIRPSIHLGGYINYQLSDVLSVQPELLYSSVGAKQSESETYEEFGFEVTEEFDATIALNYLSLPIMIQYKLGKVNLQAGPQFSFFMGGKYKGDYTMTVDGDSESESFDEDIDEFMKVKGLDLGFNLGLGMDFDKLNVGLRYSAGLSAVNDEGDDKITNNVIQLSVGYKLFGAE